MLDKKNIHFIVGMSRAGTTWLSQCLNQHSEVVVFGETCFFGRNNIAKEGYNREDINFLIEKLKNNDLDNTVICEKDGGVFQRIKKTLDDVEVGEGLSKKEIFYSICNDIASSENKTTAIEKTPHHVNSIDEIRRLFPDSKLIIMRRDAYSFMRSYKFIGDIKEDNLKKEFKNVFHPLGNLLVYRKYLKSIEVVSKLKNTLLIDFLELKNNPEKITKRVQEFLDLKSTENITLPRINSSFNKKKVKTLALEDLVWLKLFGMGNSFALKWSQLIKAPFVFLVSILKLPIWAINVYRQISKVSTVHPLSYITNLLK